MKPAHRRGSYNVNSTRLNQLARNNPNTICWRCGQPLDHHPTHRNGRPPFWTAGHTIDGNNQPTPWHNVTQQPPPGNWLAPEASTCNYSHGNKTSSNPHSRKW